MINRRTLTALSGGGRSWLAAAVSGAWSLMTSVLDDLLIIRIIILRNLKTKYDKNPLGLLLEFAQPVVVCTVHYFYFSLTGRPVPSHQYLIFVLGGFSVWFCFIGAYKRIYRGPSSGNATNIPGVTLMHLCLASAIWSFCVFFTFANLIAYPCMLLGQDIHPPDVVASLMIYGIAASMGLGFGLCTWALTEVLPAVIPFVKLFKWALFITSGIYDSLSTMSLVTAPLIQYNPLIHLAENERHAFYPGYPTFFVSMTYPAVVTAVLLFTGLLVHRALGNRQELRAAAA